MTGTALAGAVRTDTDCYRTQPSPLPAIQIGDQTHLDDYSLSLVSGVTPHPT